SYMRAMLTAPKVVGVVAPETCNRQCMLRARLACVIAALALAGCGNDLGYGTQELGPDASTVIPASGGLPCDVKAILSDHCQACHGATLAGGAPIHLVTYDDLAATNSSGVAFAQRALDRMRNATAQMPPLPASSVTATEITAFQAWVAAGTPRRDCTTGGGGT